VLSSLQRGQDLVVLGEDFVWDQSFVLVEPHSLADPGDCDALGLDRYRDDNDNRGAVPWERQ
jgi:hypothetical protein